MKWIPLNLTTTGLTLALTLLRIFHLPTRKAYREVPSGFRGGEEGNGSGQTEWSNAGNEKAPQTLICGAFIIMAER